MFYQKSGKTTVKTLTEKIIEGLRDLNFLDVKFGLTFRESRSLQITAMTALNMKSPQIPARV